MDIPTWVHAPPIWLTSLFVLACALYLYQKALKTRQNPYLWFGIGIFFGFYGILAFFLFRFIQKRRKPNPQVALVTPLLPKIILQEGFWYYLDESKATIGPVSHQKLLELFSKGIVDTKTLIWNESLDAWKKLEEFLIK